MGFQDVKRKAPDNPVRIIATANQKGGVGKTTTAVNLAAALAECGYKTLLIDLDPQGNAGTGVGFDKSKCKHCVYDALLHDYPVADVIYDTDTENLFLTPATIDLAGAELELVSAISRESRLTSAMEPVKNEFDYIVIDCPPSLGLLTLNGLSFATELIVPVQCEYYALEGVAKLLDTIRQIKVHLNPELQISGVLITMFDGRTNLASDVVDQFTGYFGEKLFETRIPRTIRISEAPGYGEPITTYDSKGKGAEAYRAFAKEVINRA